MIAILPYLLIPVMALCLVSAQSLWASAIKLQHVLDGNLPTIIVNLLTSWRMWVGALIYIAATLLYFYMLSRLRFFSVQIAMTAISIIFSVGLSMVLFNERPGIINTIGILIVLAGIVMVLYR